MWLCSGFSRTVEECDQHEIDFSGYPYTQEHKFLSGDLVEEKLDRNFVNSLWYQKFLEEKVENLIATGFYHSPIFLKVVKMDYGVQR